MANTELNIWLKLKDQVSASLDRMKGRFKSFTSDMQTNWVALASKVYLAQQAIRAVTNVVGVFIKSATEQEDAFNRLRNAIELNGEDAERLTLKYAELAKGLQKTTRYGDEAIEQLMQQLISVGSVTEDKMERATKVAIDFASATGRDLTTASLTVAKAMAGFTGELSRYGIFLDETTDKTSKAESALKAMEKQFGGFAQRDVKTFSGSIEQLKNKWGDLQEVIGEFITKSPKVKGAVDSIGYAFEWWAEKIATFNKQVGDSLEADLTRQLNDVNKEIEKQMGFIERGTYHVKESEEKINQLLIQQRRLREALDKKKNESNEDDLGKIIIKSTQEKNDQLKDDTKKTFNAMEEFAKESARNIQDSFADFFFSAFKGELNSLKDVFTSFGDAMLKTLSNLMAQAMVTKMFTSMGLGGILGFQTGTPYVPYTGIYQLHKGEKVTPAHEAGGDGSGVNITLNQIISAWDAEDVYRNRKTIASAMVEEIRRNAPIRDAIRRV